MQKSINIKLSNGEETKIDKEFKELISTFRWHKTPNGYVKARISTKRVVFLHRFILNLNNESRDVDHINRDRLDNRRSNLRLVTRSQNLQRKIPQSNNTSGYKGVWFEKRRNRWVAELSIPIKKKIYLGQFIYKAEAIRAYNKAARKYFGKFAYQNQI